MLKSLAPLVLAIGALATPSAHLDAHHANNNTAPVARAASTPGNLWGNNNAPDPYDIYQAADRQSLLNPGVLAELSALAAHNPEWIKRLVTYTGDPATITEVTVNLYDRGTSGPIHFKYQKAGQDPARSDAAEGWWVGAVEMAKRLGPHQPSTTYPENTLDMLTGRAVKSYVTKDYTFYGMPAPQGSETELIDKERAWEIIKNGPNEPLVLSSRAWSCVGNILPCGQSFAVIGGHGGTNGEPRWVTTLSRTAVRATADLDAIFPEITMIYGFANGAAEKP